MSITGIQDQLLEVTVVGCNKLKDTEWFSKQDPYVCLEYGSTKFSTKTCTDGDKDPVFQEKFVFTLIEGLREISVTVWNSNTIASDVFIGSRKVQLQKVLSQGYDDTAWPLQTRGGRNAGEMKSILHYPNALKQSPKKKTKNLLQKHITSFAPSTPPHITQPMPQVPLYYNPVPTITAPYAPPAPAAPYAPPACPAPAPNYSYPPNLARYPPSQYAAPPPVRLSSPTLPTNNILFSTASNLILLSYR